MDDFQIENITIPSVSVKGSSKSKQFAVFELTVEATASGTRLRWNVHRRYSDFDELHNKLVRSGYPGIPDLPGKRILGEATTTISLTWSPRASRSGAPTSTFSFLPTVAAGNFSQTFLETRRSQLEVYLKEVAQSPEAARSPGFMGFIGAVQFIEQKSQSSDADGMTAFPYTFRSGRYNPRQQPPSKDDGTCHTPLACSVS